jgi:hypothetical protein
LISTCFSTHHLIFAEDADHTLWTSAGGPASGGVGWLNTWVDQFDTFGLGSNVPIATGNENESLLALVHGKFVNLRVPYPAGYYTKWMDGRIDDPNVGWKGRDSGRPSRRGPWFTSTAARAPGPRW